jgi:hypothetical protein
MMDVLRETKSFSLNPEIYEKLSEEAQRGNLSVSRKLENILIEYFGMNKSDQGGSKITSEAQTPQPRSSK